MDSDAEGAEIQVGRSPASGLRPPRGTRGGRRVRQRETTRTWYDDFGHLQLWLYRNTAGDRRGFWLGKTAYEEASNFQVWTVSTFQAMASCCTVDQILVILFHAWRPYNEWARTHGLQGEGAEKGRDTLRETWVPAKERINQQAFGQPHPPVEVWDKYQRYRGRNPPSSQDAADPSVRRVVWKVAKAEPSQRFAERPAASCQAAGVKTFAQHTSSIRSFPPKPNKEGAAPKRARLEGAASERAATSCQAAGVKTFAQHTSSIRSFPPKPNKEGAAPKRARLEGAASERTKAYEEELQPLLRASALPSFPSFKPPASPPPAPLTVREADGREGGEGGGHKGDEEWTEDIPEDIPATSTVQQLKRSRSHSMRLASHEDAENRLLRAGRGGQLHVHPALSRQPLVFGPHIGAAGAWIWVPSPAAFAAAPLLAPVVTSRPFIETMHPEEGEVVEVVLPSM